MCRFIFFIMAVFQLISCNSDNQITEKDKKIEALENKIEELEKKIEEGSPLNENLRTTTHPSENAVKELNQPLQVISKKYVFGEISISETIKSPDNEKNKETGTTLFYNYDNVNYTKVTNALTIDNFNEDAKYRLIDVIKRKLNDKKTLIQFDALTSIDVTDVKVNVYSSYADASIARQAISNASELIVQYFEL